MEDEPKDPQIEDAYQRRNGHGTAVFLSVF